MLKNEKWSCRCARALPHLKSDLRTHPHAHFSHPHMCARSHTKSLQFCKKEYNISKIHTFFFKSQINLKMIHFSYAYETGRPVECGRILTAFLEVQKIRMATL